MTACKTGLNLFNIVTTSKSKEELSHTKQIKTTYMAEVPIKAP